MTEAEWLACDDPTPMIKYLELGSRGTYRQLRLLGVAFCHRFWPFCADERIRRVIDQAEGHADGQVTAKQLRLAHRRSSTLCRKLEVASDSPKPAYALSNMAVAANWVSASDVRFRTTPCPPLPNAGYLAAATVYIAASAADAIFYATYDGPAAAARELIVRRNVAGDSTATHPILDTEEKAQADLLRCVLGNPFRPVTFDPSWRTATVLALAEGIYADRAFDRLPILADALQDAGCEDPDILSHCRGPGPHVRGCWVVDLVLGKS